ncbi:ABC transporter permease [soil metagenome]
MLHNYFLIIFRTLAKKKTYAAINVLGLAIGMAAFMSIITFVSYELSYDKFWNDHQNIFRATLKTYQGEVITNDGAANWVILGALTKMELPEVKNATRFVKAQRLPTYPKHVELLYDNNKKVEINSESLIASDSSFFQVFSFKFIKGDPDAYVTPNSIVLPAFKADVLFGEQWRTSEPGSPHDPIGKTIYLRSASQVIEQFTLIGIIENFPPNSHFYAEGIFHHEFFTSELHLTWGPGGTIFYTYLKLYSNTHIPTFQKKINDLGKQNKVSVDQGYRYEFPLQPLESIFLGSNLEMELKPSGNKTVIYALSIVAGMVLILAWLNYLNLTMVQSMERAREVGLRKVIGARKSNLVKQFLLNSLVINFFSAILAVIILHFSLPLLNQFLGTNLELSIYSKGIPREDIFWVIFILVYFIGSIISGLYPALVLSSFKPIVALKGKVSSRASVLGVNVRSGIITFQFVISFLLVIGTLAVINQTRFMQSQSLGFESDKMVIIENLFAKDTTYSQRVDHFKDQLSASTIFTQTSVSSSYPGHFYSNWHYANEGSEDFKSFTLISVDYDFFNCYGIPLTVGRTFSKEFPNDVKNIIVNEAAMELLGFNTEKDIIRQKIKDDVHKLNLREIIGVVKNHHHSSLHAQPYPIIYLLTDAEFYYGLAETEGKMKFPGNNQFITVKVAKEKAITEAISSLQEIWKQSFSDEPLHFFFLDDQYNQQYKSEILFGKVFTLFSILAIIIASMGLSGFIAYSVRQRVKEIGIRKVFGATLTQLWLLLTKVYLGYIFIAFLISFPLAYLLIDKWLDNFAYRIILLNSWWVFLIPVLLMIFVALLTVSGQAIKAALANPKDSLQVD